MPPIIPNPNARFRSSLGESWTGGFDDGDGDAGDGGDALELRTWRDTDVGGGSGAEGEDTSPPALWNKGWNGGRFGFRDKATAVVSQVQNNKVASDAMFAMRLLAQKILRKYVFYFLIFLVK